MTDPARNIFQETLPAFRDYHTARLSVFLQFFRFRHKVYQLDTITAADQHINHRITPAPPVQQDDENYDSQDEEEVLPDPRMLPDSVMGVEIPEGMDSMVNQMANEAMRMAKEWAKQQIDNLGK